MSNNNNNMSNNNNNNNNTKYSTLRLLFLVSSFLATSNAFQVVNPMAGGAWSTTTSTSTTSLGYTVATDVPESTLTYAFEESMRNLVKKNTAKSNTLDATSTFTSTTTTMLPNIMSVSTLREYHEQVEQSHQLTVVRFHAPYCRACKAMAPLLERFAKQHPSIKFVQVELDSRNAEIQQLMHSLDINKVPYGLVYHPTIGRVESASFNKAYFAGVEQMITSYEQGACPLPEQVDEFSHVYEAPYALRR